jgi:predicted RNA-binding Zn ribbon-like protein
VLDFANTVAWRTDPTRRVERVVGAHAWVRWALAAGLLSREQSAGMLDSTAMVGANAATTATVANAETPTLATVATVATAQEPLEHQQHRLAALLRLRAALWAALDALADGEPPPFEHWDELRRSVILARENAELPPEFPLRWQPRAARLEDLVHALALQAEELLGGESHSRIRRCEGPGCGWFFLDRSRNGTRRWCSSGDCGNRDRARRHYSRTRPTH